MKYALPLLLTTHFLFSSIAYPYRDLSNPPISLDENTSILQLSHPRTGSTLIFNILQYLFEDQKAGYYTDGSRVIKSHYFPNAINDHPLKSNIIVCQTIRDPLNIFASLVNTNHSVTFGRITDPLRYIPKKHPFNITVLTFMYEHFENDHFDYIYDVIEDGLSITIPPSEKEKMKRYFCVNAVKQIQEKYDGFKEYDIATGIHGNHITHSSWTQTLTLKQALKAHEKNLNLRRKWGYADLDIEKLWHEANPS